MIQKARKLKTDKRLETKFKYQEYLNPEKCYYHLSSTRCKKSETLIEIGDSVKIGDVIAIRDGGFFKQNVHATISGIYTGNEKKLYRDNRLVDYMVIENDFKETYTDTKTSLRVDEMLKLSNEDILNRVRNNSIVGMGGSSFPTYIKFETDKKINTIIINGVECEPYLVSDVNTMYKYANEIITGCMVSMKYFKAEKTIICVKAYKTKLVKHLNDALKQLDAGNIEICQTPNYYPQGYEKEAIKTATNVYVAPNQMPADLGFMVFNSTSMLAIHDAIRYNMPVINREISLIGRGFKQQMDLTVKVGSSINDIITKFNAFDCEDNSQVLISGGPMMGSSLKSDDLVVTKAFSTLTTLPPVEDKPLPCINCGSCVNSCPVNLQPVLINNALSARNKEALANLNVKNCVECGLCSYVCTSKIDLTKNMRRSKRMI